MGPMRPPSLFVGSSGEARQVAQVVTSLLRFSLACVPWWEAFAPSTFTLEALEAARTAHRFGVFIARADDILLRRGRCDDVVRDNVIAEFFLFVGANGRDHTYLVVEASVMPTLPSDLAGFVFTTYDADAFSRNAAEALNEACHRILRRVHEVHEQDTRREREREAAALNSTNAQHIAELADLAFLLRDLIDGVERDTLEALLDEKKFGDIKAAALNKIETLCAKYEPKARSAKVLDEFARLQEAVKRTVAALPFPTDLFQGFDEAKSVYGNSVFGSIEPLAEAVNRKDWPTAFEIGMSMRGKLSIDMVAAQVAAIMEDRLHRLKTIYADWWKANSRALQQRLSDFQRVLFRAQTRLALRAADSDTESEAR
jgi:hypothetical protein